MENKNQWYKKSQWYTSLWMLPIYIIVLITVLTSIINSIPSGKNNDKRKENAVPVTIADSAPVRSLSEEDQIRQLTSKQLEGLNNNGKAYARKIEVVKQIDGGWGVFTEYNADDNFNANLRKEGIERKMSDIYIALYVSGKDIRTASVTAYYPTVDKYGNTSDSVAYKTMLEKTEADKVNWSADKYQLETDILPKVWKTTLINSEFQK